MVYHRIVIFFCLTLPRLFKSYLDLKGLDSRLWSFKLLVSKLLNVFHTGWVFDMREYGTYQVLKLGKRKRAHPQSIFPTPLRNGRLEGVQILNQIRAHLNNERNWKEIIRNQPHPIICSFWSIPDGRTWYIFESEYTRQNFDLGDPVKHISGFRLAIHVIIDIIWLKIWKMCYIQTSYRSEHEIHLGHCTGFFFWKNVQK